MKLIFSLSGDLIKLAKEEITELFDIKNSKLRENLLITEIKQNKDEIKGRKEKPFFRKEETIDSLSARRRRQTCADLLEGIGEGMDAVLVEAFDPRPVNEVQQVGLRGRRTWRTEYIYIYIYIYTQVAGEETRKRGKGTVVVVPGSDGLRRKT